MFVAKQAARCDSHSALQTPWSTPLGALEEPTMLLHPVKRVVVQQCDQQEILRCRYTDFDRKVSSRTDEMAMLLGNLRSGNCLRNDWWSVSKSPHRLVKESLMSSSTRSRCDNEQSVPSDRTIGTWLELCQRLISALLPTIMITCL